MTLALGSWPRQGHAKVQTESAMWKSHTLLGTWESVREWTHTLPSELPFWKLESIEFLKNGLRGRNSLNWKLPNIIGKFFRCKFLKWVRIIHLNIYDTSYDWKKGWKLKCQFDSWPLKVKNHLELHAWQNLKIQSIIYWTKIFILDSKKIFQNSNIKFLIK